MIAPAMNDLAQSLDMIHSEFEIYLSLSIFILGYAIGPVFFGPASEVYGRVRILQVSNLWYLGWNLGCGFARHKGVLFACRFLAGAGGSAPLAVGGGAIRLVVLFFFLSLSFWVFEMGEFGVVCGRVRDELS